MSKDQLDAMNLLIKTLSKIANGRTDNGRPLPAEESRQIARNELRKFGISWSSEIRAAV